MSSTDKRSAYSARAPPRLSFLLSKIFKRMEEAKMGFYYAKEKRDFDREWEKLRREYQTAGMSEDDIQALYEFDLEWFYSRRRFMEHTQPFPAETFLEEDSDAKSDLYKKFCNLTTRFDEEDFRGAYSWVDAIGDEDLFEKLKSLSETDLLVLTLLVEYEKTQCEIAGIRGCTQSAIGQRIKKIKKILE